MNSSWAVPVSLFSGDPVNSDSSKSLRPSVGSLMVSNGWKGRLPGSYHRFPALYGAWKADRSQIERNSCPLIIKGLLKRRVREDGMRLK